MRIAHVTATFPPYMAGTGNVCYYNALELARLGHEVTVYTAAGPERRPFDPPGVTVRRLPVVLRFGNAPLVPGLLGVRDADVIHLHYPFIFGAELVSAAARIRRIPLVLTYHNDLVGEGLRRYLFGAYVASTAGFVLGTARKLAVVSEEHARSCAQAPYFAGRWKDVAVIPNGVDTGLFRPRTDGSAVRRKFGITDAERVIAFVGALDRAHFSKGVPTLLEAAAALAREDVILMIVGDGEWKARYQLSARKLGIGSRTIFTGMVPFPSLPEYYNAADAVALPSTVESFGMVLIEAMACRKPVIASDLPGVRSVVTDGRDGFLVPPGDPAALAAKIRAVVDDPQLRITMGHRGREKVEQRYAWPVVIPRLVDLYGKAVSSARIRKGWTDV
jgi:glycosyltransferase involved in cell wall biosynthesis